MANIDNEMSSQVNKKANYVTDDNLACDEIVDPVADYMEVIFHNLI